MMRMDPIFRVATMAVVALSVLSAAHAQLNLVVNGSFENPALNSSWDVFPSIPGWTLSYGPAIEIGLTQLNRAIRKLEHLTPAEK